MDIIGLIDIDETLRAMDDDPHVIVDLGNGGYFEVLIDVPKQVRLVQKYDKPAKFGLNAEMFDKVMALQKQTGKDNPSQKDFEDVLKGHESEFSLEIDSGQSDFYGLGVALADYLTGWRGFKGAFSKEKARKYLQRMSRVAETFGANFKNLLEKYEEAHERRIEAETKNS
jgi:hypothetical protein